MLRPATRPKTDLRQAQSLRHLQQYNHVDQKLVVSQYTPPQLLKTVRIKHPTDGNPFVSLGYSESYVQQPGTPRSILEQTNTQTPPMWAEKTHFPSIPSGMAEPLRSPFTSCVESQGTHTEREGGDRGVMSFH